MRFLDLLLITFRTRKSISSPLLLQIMYAGFNWNKETSFYCNCQVL